MRQPECNLTELPVVLVADDDADTAEVLRMIVEELIGWRALVVESGQAALRAAAEHGPDLILLDLSLPIMSGYEVATRLRQDPRTATIPIYAVSGFGRAEDRAEAAAAGCDGLIAKPFDIDDLEARIKSAVAERRSE